MTLPEADGEEYCLAFVSGNIFRSLRCSSVSHSRNGWIGVCLLGKGLFPVLCSTVSHLCQAPEQMALRCSPLGSPEGLHIVAFIVPYEKGHSLNAQVKCKVIAVAENQYMHSSTI